MKGVILIATLSIFFLQACTQTRFAQKGYAFSQHINFGTIAVDNNGNQLTPGSQTNRFIYLECKGNNQPKITQVNYKGTIYTTPSISLAGQKSIQIGTANFDNKIIVITPSKGNCLWRIELPTPEKNNLDIEGSQKSKIILEGSINGKRFKLNIDNEIELQPVMGL